MANNGPDHKIFYEYFYGQSYVISTISPAPAPAWFNITDGLGQWSLATSHAIALNNANTGQIITQCSNKSWNIFGSVFLRGPTDQPYDVYGAIHINGALVPESEMGIILPATYCGLSMAFKCYGLLLQVNTTIEIMLRCPFALPGWLTCDKAILHVWGT